jgi:hypothetical protein
VLALQDLTLPLISLFTGRGFDNVIRETFKSGPQRIEDLWLRCCIIQGRGYDWVLGQRQVRMGFNGCTIDPQAVCYELLMTPGSA